MNKWQETIVAGLLGFLMILALLIAAMYGQEKQMHALGIEIPEKTQGKTWADFPPHDTPRDIWRDIPTNDEY